MGDGKLNVLRKRLHGHNNCSSHLIVDECTSPIVDRPANKGGKGLKMSTQRKACKVTFGRYYSDSKCMHTIRSKTPCCMYTGFQRGYRTHRPLAPIGPDQVLIMKNMLYVKARYSLQQTCQSRRLQELLSYCMVIRLKN